MVWCQQKWKIRVPESWNSRTRALEFSISADTIPCYCKARLFQLRFRFFARILFAFASLEYRHSRGVFRMATSSIAVRPAPIVRPKYFLFGIVALMLGYVVFHN